MYPEDYRYSKEHEWIKVDGDIGTIGITDHAQEQLGDIVDVVLPDVGKKIDQDESFGEIDSVKAASDLYCPVAGEVTEVNQVVIETPEKINEAPHDEAWLIKIRISDASELEALMSTADYQKFIENEG